MQGLNYYIHYYYGNVNSDAEQDVINISNEIQNILAQKSLSNETKASSFTDVTFKASEFLQLIGNGEEGIQKIINKVISSANGSISNDFNIIEFANEFSLEGQNARNTFRDLNKLFGSKGDLLDFKKKLQKIVNKIAKELGYTNYHILAKMVLANVRNNYGYSVSEKKIYDDFIKNCNNTHFNVNPSYKGTLTSCLNRVVLLINALPSYEGQGGNFSYSVKEISDMANKTVNWLTYCGGIVKELACQHAIDYLKYQLAKSLKPVANSFKKAQKKNDFMEFTMTSELETFINNYKNIPQNYDYSKNGILIKMTDTEVTFSVDLDIDTKENKPDYKVSSLGLSDEKKINLSEALNVLDSASRVAMYNVGSAHTVGRGSSQKDAYLSRIFDKAARDIGKNTILNSLADNKNLKNTYFIIDGEAYNRSDIIKKVSSEDSDALQTKILYGRHDLVKMNTWYGSITRNGNDALVRSGLQFSNIGKNYMIANLNLLNM